MDNTEYPAQQHYDPLTLCPANDITHNRLEHLRRQAPELWEPGDGFLDIGCARGFICFCVAGSHKRVVGWDLNGDLFKQASKNNQLRRDNQLSNNVNFYPGDHRRVPFYVHSSYPDGSYRRIPERFYCVFLGDVHHYIVDTGFKAGAPWLWIHKLKALSDRYIVIDGPHTADDFVVKRLRAEQHWPDSLASAYNIETMKAEMAPQFQLVRYVPNERGRQTSVWSRVSADLPEIVISEREMVVLRENGTDLKTDLRTKWSAIKHQGNRYKFDKGVLPAGVLQLLNHLDCFPRTSAVIVDREHGPAIGDVCPIIGGNIPLFYLDVLPGWLRMNAALSSVGLFEPQYRLHDYRLTTAGGIINIDYNMINHVFEITQDYKDRWKSDVGTLLLSEFFTRDRSCGF